MKIKANSFENQLLNAALEFPVKIVLPEYKDPRIESASSKLCDLGFDVIHFSQLEKNKEK